MIILYVLGVATTIAVLPLIIIGVDKTPNLPSSNHIGREPLYDKEK